MDAIDRDPMTAQLDRQRLCHVHQGGIAGAAAEVAGDAGVAAADVDDAAPTRRLHEGDDGAGTAQGSDIFCVEILQQILVDDRFDRAGRGGRAPWRGPAVDQDVQAAQLLRRLGDHAVHLLLAGDIGCEGNNAPVRLGSQLPRRRLQIPLVPRHDRHIDPFASQFPRNGFADAATAAGHDRMLALQPEVHGTLCPWWRDRNFIASLLIVLSEGTWRKGVARRGTMYGTCLHASGRAAVLEDDTWGAPHPKAAVAGRPARTAGFDPTETFVWPLA